MSDQVTILELLAASASHPLARIDALNALAWELLRKNPGRAVEIAEQGRSLAAEAGYQEGLASALCALGFANVGFFSRYDIAESQLSESLSIARATGDRDRQTQVINLIGTLYRRLGDGPEGVARHTEALAIAREIGNREQEAAALNGLGHALRMTGRVSQAEECHIESLRTAREANIPREEAAALNGLGNTYEKLGDFNRALAQYIETLRLAEQNDYRQMIAYASGNIAIIYQRLGDYTTALHYELESLRSKQELGDRWGEAISYNNVGVIYKIIGDYASALEAHLKSLQITEEIGDLQGQAVSLNNIGLIYESLGDTSHVLDYYLRSLRIAEQTEDRQGQACSLSHIGRYHDGQEDYPRALIYHFKGLKIYQETGDRYGERDALLNIGSIYFQVEENQKAEEYFAKGLAIAEEIGDKEGQATAQLNLGRLYHRTGRHREAAERMRTSLKTAEEIGHKDLTGQALRRLAGLYETLGDRDASAAFERMSAEVNRQLFNDEMKARVRKLIDGFERRNVRREAQLLGLPQEEFLEMNEAISKMNRLKTEQMLERAANSARPWETPDRPPAGTAIEVRTFGEFSVVINGRELRKGDWQRKRARDLFKLLLLHHRSAVTIDEMVETLWGGLSERNVELLVMNAISHIRKALDPGREPHKPSPFLSSSDRTYTLDLGDAAAIDFIRFRSLIADARRSPVPDRKRALYQEAAGLYRGEFMKEDLYETWTSETRDRLQEMLAEALSYLAAEHLRNGDLEDAVIAAKKLIQCDPISEHGYEILLDALRRTGSTAELLKAFNECTRAFQAELGVEPPERLRRLAVPL